VLNDPDQYNRKIREDLLIEYDGLHFHTTWGLFSPRAIDDGSRLLLDYLELESDSDCLDLGCGYGVLGLCMARAAPQGHTLLVDKDFGARVVQRRLSIDGHEYEVCFILVDVLWDLGRTSIRAAPRTRCCCRCTCCSDVLRPRRPPRSPR